MYVPRERFWTHTILTALTTPHDFKFAFATISYTTFIANYNPTTVFTSWRTGRPNANARLTDLTTLCNALTSTIADAFYSILSGKDALWLFLLRRGCNG